ncbi:putative proteinase inhibitor I20 [Lupinus albus]|uniref:Uncharacterized protein n=1 Tax=Lupinus albus TaxID=3870 RepID=A0A6A4R7C6_LUPAL|nr:putative proteinase inhibitor I20 [Lupinus albus]
MDDVGVLFMKSVEGSSKICIEPLVCDDAAYMICPSSGSKHVAPACNCCYAPIGCKLYRANNTVICTST